MSAPVCPATLARDDAKRRAAAAFGRALDACGYTLAKAASELGLSITRVRKLRSTDPADLDVVPSVADLILAPHDLGEAFARELAIERNAVHGPAPVVTVEQQAVAVLAADGRVQTAIASGLADRVLDGPERTEIGVRLIESQAERERLLAMVRGGKR